MLSPALVMVGSQSSIVVAATSSRFFFSASRSVVLPRGSTKSSCGSPDSSTIRIASPCWRADISPAS